MTDNILTSKPADKVVRNSYRIGDCF